MRDNPFGPFDRGGGDTIRCPYCSEPDFDAVGLKLHFLRGHCDVFNETDTRDAPVMIFADRVDGVR